MTTTLRALGVAASLLMGTALAASAATTADNQGNTPPTTSSVQPGTPMAHGYQGTPTTTPGYQTSQGSSSNNRASMTPQVDRGSAESAAGGGGTGGGGSGGGTGGGGSGR